MYHQVRRLCGVFKIYTFTEMSEQNIKTYTLEEVSQHSDVDSLWLIIHDDVYDVTKFASEHPGGVEILLDWAGQDATDGFEDANHSLDAREEMENYKIGELCQEDRGKQIETNDNNKW
ncbi:hypothetical protein CDAR_398402 [Caerostris darwini]|uniref:Cytochrome b5 n=1 Tax=Caerostris darwini TaxID=1538125 RepID=A0AAV4VF30_9ARAC|nr:hypothetical protein CDAR_398402 [Caerostris darwini]